MKGFRIRSPTTCIFLIVFFLNLFLVFFTPLNEHHDHYPHFVSPLALSTTKVNHVSITSSPHQLLSTSSYIPSYNNSSPITKFKSGINKKMTSLERIEEGNARARASIQEAIRSRNYKSTKKEVFVPKGSIYWNPHAFHQSHIEMKKRMKVWVYREGEQPLVHDGPVNNKYAIEGQFIDEMENSKSSSFKATHPDEAHVFLLPFSVAKVIRYVYKPRRSPSDYDPLRLQRLVEDYITLVAQKYPYWNRSKGADHFLLSCHDWGPRISSGKPELFKNFMRVLCNANTTEAFKRTRDVSTPEVYLPVGKQGPPNLGQHPNNRTTLAFFAGGAHGNIRSKLLERWKDRDKEVQVHE